MVVVSVSRGTLHAGMSVQDVMNALARVNWGPLRGRAWAYRRMLLETLTLMMREQRADFSAEIITSAPQVADRMGCHEKTVRNCLHDLEDLGLVEYQRGGIWDGKPMPSVIRIIKKTIVGWVLAWRPKNDERLRLLRLETIARIAGLKKARVRPCQRPEVHAEPNYGLSTLGKRARHERARSSYVSPTPHKSAQARREAREDAIQAWKATAELREEAKKDKKMSNNPPVEYMPLICGHGNPEPGLCNACRSRALSDYQAAQRAEREEAARRRAEQMRIDEAEEEAKGIAFVDYMRRTYPAARRSEWSEIIQTDREAARLASA